MYNRRIKIFLSAVAVVFASLAGRLWHLQIIQGEHFRRQIDQTLIRSDLIQAGRGQILDRKDRILAIDEPCFDLCMDYGLLSDDQRYAGRQQRAIAKEIIADGAFLQADLSDEEISSAAREEYEDRVEASWTLARSQADLHNFDLDWTVNQIRQRVERIHRRINDQPIEETWAHPVVRGLDDATAVAIRTELGQTIGLSVRPSHRRLYPYGDLACHVIGVTGPVFAEEIEQLNSRWEQADWLTQIRHRYEGTDTVGKSGLERLAEPLLRGVRGYRLRDDRAEVPIEDLPAYQGQDVRTTLDIELQDRIIKLFFPGATGSVVVIDVPTGQILAMVSIPTFDLNRYRRDYKLLSGDKVYMPLLHRAVCALYPPGSIAKIIAAIGGLTEGLITPQTQYNCAGYLHNPSAFRCWVYIANQIGHGSLDLLGAIKNSCNIYFYNVGERLGPARMVKWLEAFGFSDVVGTQLPEECPGRVENPGELGGARLLAIGQGPVAVTPLHVGNTVATIARGGIIKKPVILQDPNGEIEILKPQTDRRLDVPAWVVELVHRGMHDVVEQQGGTAYRVFHLPDVEPLGFDVCGKTGTADVPPLREDSNGDGVINSSDRIVRIGPMAWFAGFAPYRNPQVAVAVVVEYVDEGGGSANAGPIARETFRLCREQGYIK